MYYQSQTWKTAIKPQTFYYWSKWNAPRADKASGNYILTKAEVYGSVKTPASSWNQEKHTKPTQLLKLDKCTTSSGGGSKQIVRTKSRLEHIEEYSTDCTGREDVTPDTAKYRCTIILTIQVYQSILQILQYYILSALQYAF